MANHKSAAKRARQSIIRNERNRARRSKMRTFIKNVDQAIEAGDKELATAALRLAESSMARAVSKGVVKKKTMSRKISRLALSVKNIGAAK